MAAVRFSVLIVLALTVAARAEITHRYSFKDDGKTVKDTVGNVDGTLRGDAKMEDGKVVLQNTGRNSAAADLAYVDFGKSLLPKGDSASIVLWVTAKPGQTYARAFDIGDAADAQGQAFIYLITHYDDEHSRAAITAEGHGEMSFLGGPLLDDGKPHMAAIVIDGKEKKLRFYVDGKEAEKAIELGDNTLDKVRPVHNWIGRSPYDTDRGLNGSIDEFRVYDHALTADEVKAANDAGADKLPEGKATTKP